MVNLQIRLNDDIKTNADKLFQSLGLDTSTAVRMFLSKAIEENGIPFQVKHKDDFSLSKAIEDSRLRKNLIGPFENAEEAINSMLENE